MFRSISIIIFGFVLNCEFIEKNRLVEYVGAIPDGLDPAVNAGIYDSRIYSNIYESLLDLGEDGFTLHPGLAADWSVDKNLKRYVFNLESGRYFHDGSPVNAEALANSFRRQIQKNSSSPLFNMIASIEFSDSLTLIFNLKYDYAQFIYTLTSPIGLKAISKTALEKYRDDIKKHPVGTGPFKLKEWKAGQEIILDRFSEYPDFHGNVDEVVYKMSDNYSNIEKSFKNGDVDILYSVPGFYIDRLKWLGMIDYKIINPFAVIFFGFNNLDDTLKNQIVRRAILSCIDRLRLVHYILRGNSIIAKGPIPPVFSLSIEQSQPEFDLPLAQKLMKETGIRDTVILKLYYIDRFRARNTILEFLKNELEKVHLSLELIAFDSYEELNNACRSDTSQLFLTGWQADVLGDPENFLYSLFYSTSDYNFFHYNNQQVDSWLDTARIESDWKRRQILYQKIMRQILEDTPAIFLYHVIPVYAYNRHKIKLFESPGTND